MRIPDADSDFAPKGDLHAGEAAGPTKHSAGARVGPYVLKRLLGRGAFGEVWLAERDSAIARNLLAVKLPARDAVDLSAVRSEAEARVRAGNHPNVLPLFEANVYAEQAVVVSEYAPDGSLKDWLSARGGKAPSIEAAVDMAMAVLAGLEHLHIRGVVHRDLKPANILMQGESPRIADFGLARAIDDSTTLGRAAGTPAYMAPEAFAGVRSVQTDLWSVGVILHELLCGSRPQANEPTSSPVLNSLPASLRGIVMRALAEAPERRLRSAAEMRAALRDALQGLEPGASPPKFVVRRGCRSIAVTGTFHADPVRAANRMPTLLHPYCDHWTTWYCGSLGVVDVTAAEFLLGESQRLISVARNEDDVSPAMERLIRSAGGAIVDARHEQTPPIAEAPSKRDVYISSRADLLIIVWDGVSPGTAKLLKWLNTLKKDHVVGYL